MYLKYRIFSTPPHFCSRATFTLWSRLLPVLWFIGTRKKSFAFILIFPSELFFFHVNFRSILVSSPPLFRPNDLICECVRVLSVDSIFFSFNSPSLVSVIICNSDYLFYGIKKTTSERECGSEREKRREREKKRFNRRYTKHLPLSIAFAIAKACIYIYTGIVYWIFN